MPAYLENSAVATELEKSVFILIPKNGNAKECSNYYTNCAHFTCQFGKAQNPLSQALAICELRTSRCIVEFRKGRERETKLPTSVGSDR